MCRTTARGAAVVALLVGLCAPGLRADQVKLNVALGRPFLLADQKHTAHLKIGLTGFTLDSEEQRTPVNVAIVIDKSGSMSGEKIKKAKEAATMAIDRLASKDIVSLVAYDHTVNVLMPATKVSDKAAIRAAIDRLAAGGNTALFAGVSKGADEVRKFLDSKRVNRIILLSDGLANVGPSSPSELGDLGASLIKEGISVTTIGLGTGYNEDLMTQLARRSDGNHSFVREPADLAKIFKYEFGDVLSVVAQEVVVKIDCAEGIRPARVLGREADIAGQTVVTTLNQLYSEQEKYILLEVDIPATPEGKIRDVATVSLSYLNMQTRTTDRLTSSMGVRFTKSEQTVHENANADVLVAAVEQVANDNNKRALELRDEGKIEEAKEALQRNAAYLKANADKYESEKLRSLQAENDLDAQNLDPDNWNEQRKDMRYRQHRTETQQAH